MMPVLQRKSAPRMTSYLHLPLNTRALFSSTHRFLSNSGKRISRRCTTSSTEKSPPKVVTLLLRFSFSREASFGKTSSWIRVFMEPESKRTLRIFREVCKPMVLQIIIVIGVTIFLDLGPLEPTYRTRSSRVYASMLSSSESSSSFG